MPYRPIEKIDEWFDLASVMISDAGWQPAASRPEAGVFLFLKLTCFISSRVARCCQPDMPRFCQKNNCLPAD